MALDRVGRPAVISVLEPFNFHFWETSVWRSRVARHDGVEGGRGEARMRRG